MLSMESIERNRHQLGEKSKENKPQRLASQTKDNFSLSDGRLWALKAPLKRTKIKFNLND